MPKSENATRRAAHLCTGNGYNSEDILAYNKGSGIWGVYSAGSAGWNWRNDHTESAKGFQVLSHGKARGVSGGVDVKTVREILMT